MKSALVHPNSILGQAVQQRLQASSVLTLDSLLTTHGGETGVLSEADEGAALIQQLHGDEADLYFVCGDLNEQRSVAEQVQSGVIIHLEPSADPDPAWSVAGASDAAASAEGPLLRLQCPSAISVALTHLLGPLADVDLFGSVVALQGASSTSGAALDELLEQTRALLSFSGEMPANNLRTQLAFNALDFNSGNDLERELDSLLPGIALSTRLLEVGIFHGVGLVVDLRLRREGSAQDLAEDVRQRLSSDPYIEISDGDDPLGTIDAAGSDGILLAQVRSNRHGVGLWAVFDNLTLAARNAVDVAERLPDRWLKVN